VIPELRPRSVGEVLDAAVLLYRARFGALMKAAAIVVIPLTVLILLIQLSALPDEFTVGLTGEATPVDKPALYRESDILSLHVTMLDEVQKRQANGVDRWRGPQGNTNPQLSSVLPSTSLVERITQAELIGRVHVIKDDTPSIDPEPWSLHKLVLIAVHAAAERVPNERILTAPGLAKAKDLELAGEVALFKEIMSDWGFTHQEASAVLGYKEPTFATELFKGLTSIRQRDAEERLQLIITIAVDLEGLYRDYDVIKKWLRKPHELLQGATPLKVATEGTSLDLFKLSEYVEYLSGR
jgi:hypothetical protein